MFLRDFGHITRTTIIATVTLGVGAIVIPRTGHLALDSHQYTFSPAFSRFVPFIRAHAADLQGAMNTLSAASRPVDRMLDIGYAFLLTSLVLLAIRLARKRGNLSARLDTPYRVSAVLVILYVLDYLGRQVVSARVWPLISTSVAPPWSTDILETLVYAWFAVYVFVFDRAQAPRPLVFTRRALAVALVFVQATGLAYRYSDLTFAPSPAFAVLLACAYVVAPVQILLALITTYAFARTDA